MKAAVLHQYNETLTGDSFVSYEDVPDPKIENLTDVIVRIGGAGVCRTDLDVVEGIWRSKVDIKLPYTMGHENAGWIEIVGSSVTGLRVTAYRAAKKASRHLLPGEYAVVIGSGGLGHIGIQVLAALGAAEIVVVDSSDMALLLANRAVLIRARASSQGRPCW